MNPELLNKIKELGILYYSDSSIKDLESSIAAIEEHNKLYPDDMMEFLITLIKMYRDQIFGLDKKIQDLYFNSLTALVSTLWNSEVNNFIIEEAVRSITKVFLTSEK